jgi:hypothetical protein
MTTRRSRAPKSLGRRTACAWLYGPEADAGADGGDEAHRAVLREYLQVAPTWASLVRMDPARGRL